MLLFVWPGPVDPLNCERLSFCTYRENDPGWDIEIQDDVIDECNKHGGVIHIYVDKKSAEVCSHICWTTLRESR